MTSVCSAQRTATSTSLRLCGSCVAVAPGCRESRTSPAAAASASSRMRASPSSWTSSVPSRMMTMEIRGSEAMLEHLREATLVPSTRCPASVPATCT